MDDGTTIQWDDTIVVNKVEKPASFDDIDRTKLSNLLTVNPVGDVVHSIGFSPEERTTKLAVWRSFWLGNAPISPLERRGALVGYNHLLPNGHTELKLDYVSNTGEVMSGAGAMCDLHSCEVFSQEAADAIVAAQEAERVRTEEDNALLEASQISEQKQPVEEQSITDENGDII